MELVKCIRNVKKTLEDDFIEVFPPVYLFIEGNIYPVFQDSDKQWLTTDEEGQPHLIAESTNDLSDDFWFQYHFVVL
ncbi:hypothetical protein [Bacillus sp. FJAT-45350]|uniref:hypothetical protein n=1 Tax=Bacillus sp. FJAT-45350 TaxID=2011014 RepID=UPI000BB84E1F|nr:hypothetical protein [Bacillus sp. FJAT-45350]